MKYDTILLPAVVNSRQSGIEYQRRGEGVRYVLCPPLFQRGNLLGEKTVIGFL
jgi:hypothetical protein